jgi:hypothetical protein
MTAYALPPVVAADIWQRHLDELRVREKAVEPWSNVPKSFPQVLRTGGIIFHVQMAKLQRQMREWSRRHPTLCGCLPEDRICRRHRPTQAASSTNCLARVSNASTVFWLAI